MVANKYKRLVLTGCCLLCASVLGCTAEIDPNEALARVNDTNIKRLSNLYFTYQTKNNFKGPKNEEEFKKFLKSYNPKKLSRIGIDPTQIDGLFSSERDGQPFKIRYSVPGSPKGSSSAVVFEAEGVDGKRRVGFLNMTQREVEEAEYENLWSVK